MNRTIGVYQLDNDETGSEISLTTIVYNREGQPLMTTDANGDTT